MLRTQSIQQKKNDFQNTYSRSFLVSMKMKSKREPHAQKRKEISFQREMTQILGLEHQVRIPTKPRNPHSVRRGFLRVIVCCRVEMCLAQLQVKMEKQITEPS